MAAKAEYRYGKRTIACTNVDRVVFPDDGITKGDLIQYYAVVAEAMVPELAGRPLTVERFTKGLAGGGFYQKHYQKHYPDWLDSVEMSGKTPVIYPIVDDAAGLVYMANQGAIALHVCTVRKAALHNPDLLVYDLDPPEGGFALVRKAAHALHDVLGELELPAFVKTTGSKGLHVVAPLDATATYEDVQALGDGVARLLCDRYPADFTTEFYKKDRKGRLFLDTMRNGFGATLVAAYSLRGRPGAPVSTPLRWDEVDDPELTADRYTLATVPDRLEAWGDPWHTLRERPGSAKAARKKLGQL